MCGIVGIYRFDGRPADELLLRRQLAWLRHRGPDSQGLYLNGPVGLGNARLAIVDPSPAGHQPMRAEHDAAVLTYNGMLYNFRDLKRALKRPYTFRGASDTEVLLYAFLDHGPAVFPQLEGMFAFAVYERASGDLWLVRDGFGIKPLYYHRNARRLVFASEIKPLLLEAETPRAPNEHALRQHLLLGYAADPETAFQDIYRLPPGWAMRVRSNGVVQAAPYWEVDHLLQAPCGDFLETLRESVALHLTADTPVGLFLSAGLDSTMILSDIARNAPLPRGFAAYNVGLDAADPLHLPDDKLQRDVANRLCAHYGVPLVKLHPRAADNISLAEMSASVEEPICDPTHITMDQICMLARRHGMAVMLTGHGGDEGFAGYRRHLWVRYAQWVRRSGLATPLRWASAFTRNTLLHRMSASVNGDADRTGVHPLISIGAMGWDLVAERRVCPEWFPPAALADVVQPLTDKLARWRAHSPLKQMLLLDLCTYLTCQNLINVDKASMRRSIEVRVPFLYRPLVAIGLQAPDDQLIAGFRNKAMIRRAARRCLPDYVLRVPKLGFGPPEALVVADEESRELLFGKATRERGLFSEPALRALFDRITLRTPHRAMQLCAVMMIEQWHRVFMDRDPVAQTTPGG